MSFFGRTIVLGFTFFLTTAVGGQGTALPLAETWYDPGQRYFKFEVSEEGIYRITAEELAAAGVPLSEIHPDRLRLYSLGLEEALYVSASAPLKTGDYLEFYAAGNDGTLDASMYSDPSSQQLNPRYSLFTDKRPYFLTWDREGQATLPARRYRNQDNGLDGAGLPPKESYYLHRIDTVFSNFHFKPTHDGRNYIRYSSMDVAEGYGRTLSNETHLTFDLPNLVPRTLDLKLKIRFGTNVLSRSHAVYVNDVLVKNVSQTGFGVVELVETIDRQVVEEGRVRLTIRGLTGSLDKHTLAFVEIQYPHSYEFDGIQQRVYVQQPSIISRYIEIPAETLDQNETVRFYNTDLGYYITAEVKDQLVRFVSPASFTADRMVMTTSSSVKRIDQLKEIEIIPQLVETEYLILTHPDYLDRGSEEYARYRRSQEGGSHRVELVDASRLYDAFGYGIEGHTQALVNYFDALARMGWLPDYVFILGKGLEYPEIRNLKESLPYIPTFGVPGSDNLLIRSGDHRFPAVPIGRLAARSNAQIMDYLDKVRLHENPESSDQTIAGQGWKKKIIHLSGGSADIQELLFTFLQDMGGIISYNKFGADVSTFRKTSADPIQQTMSQEIIDRINEGAALITFFGHSAVGTFDFSLEDPSRYDNRGKNPVIISLGCHSGNIHTSFPGVSEEFVLEPENGAIAFIASSGTAFPGPQYNMGATIYDLLGGAMYGMPIGQIIHKVLEEQSGQTSIEVQTLAQQFTLHGDPAYRYHIFEGPDLVIDPTSVKIDPDLLNSSTDRFSVYLDVVNLGAAIDGELDVRLIHTTPDGHAIDTVELTIPAPANRAPIEVEFHNPGAVAVGINKIYVEVDPYNLIQEFPKPEAENNNELRTSTGEEGHRFFILDNSARPLYPENYGIVNETEGPELISVINNALAPGGTFIIQIDTTGLFNSPMLLDEEIVNTSSFITWRPKIEWFPGTVYYWRIRPLDDELLNLKKTVWRTSSFVYLPESERGWNQSHYFQWTENSFYKTEIDHQRQLRFSPRIWDIRIKNELGDPSDFWVFVNNTPWASLNPKELAPGIAVFVWNEQDVIFQNSGNDFGSIPFSQDGFVFKVDEQNGRKGLMDLLDAAPSGSRVFVHTILSSPEDDLHLHEWGEDRETIGTDLFEVLEGYGALKVRQLLDRGTVPYTFVFDKGGKMVVEDIANQIEETIDLSSTGRSLWDEGNMQSIDFGPANRWMRLRWEEQKEAEDETTVHVYGLRSNGDAVLLKEINGDYDVNLTSINPMTYSKIRLKYVTSDPANKTSAQITHWRVIYTDLPDPAIYSDQSEFDIADTVNAGQPLALNFEVRNLTDAHLDPVLVRFRLTNEQNEEAVFVRRIDPISGRGGIRVKEEIPTYNLSGKYRIEIEVNPNGEVREVTDCNNFGYTEIHIRPDELNPVLEVTFDGRSLRSGELVQRNPEIAISLYDENKFVLLDDSSIFDVTLTYPGQLTWKVHSDDPGVNFKPATDLAHNEARLLIHPNFNLEGTYVLEVQARDIAGNKSGPQKYRVVFQVGDFDPAQSFRVFPNPVKDKTTIQYYLKGDRSPDVFLFNIYTADGILVKTLYRSDFGGIHPGINQAEWNATNQAGEMLANGIYFYELVTDVEVKREKKKGSLILIR